MDLSTLVERMSCAPARSMGLADRRGSLAEGRWADVTLLELEREWTVDPAAFLSLSRNTPFAGRRLRGRAVRTLVGGQTVWQG
jgi:dihydroorotase